jgi:hypothetical protein
MPSHDLSELIISDEMLDRIKRILNEYKNKNTAYDQKEWVDELLLRTRKLVGKTTIVTLPAGLNLM